MKKLIAATACAAALALTGCASTKMTPLERAILREELRTDPQARQQYAKICHQFVKTRPAHEKALVAQAYKTTPQNVQGRFCKAALRNAMAKPKRNY